MSVSNRSAKPTASPLRDFRSAYAWLAWAVFLLTFLKGFRLPNSWSANLFAFNYSQGFVRRGLLGEMARQVAGERALRYELFVGVAFALFLILAACFALLIRQALRSDPEDLGLRAAVLAVGASTGLIFLVHTVGYTDYVGLISLFLILLWGQRSRRPYLLFYVILGACILFSLVHEGLSLLLGPALVFLMLCHILRLSAAAPLLGRTWVLLLAHALICSALVLSLSSVISLIGVEDLQRVQKLQAHVQAHADFPIRLDAFEVLQRSSKENLTRLMPWYWSLEMHVERAQLSWQSFAPAYLWLIAYGVLAIRRASLPGPSIWLVTSLFLGASVAPQAFNFVGWDWGRWNAFSLLSSFFCIIALKVYFPTRASSTVHPLMVSAGLVVTAIGLASTTPLFDGVDVQFFPFDAHQELLEKWSEEGVRLQPG